VAEAMGNSNLNPNLSRRKSMTLSNSRLEEEQA
jgi:hypothetical protein